MHALARLSAPGRRAILGGAERQARDPGLATIPIEVLRAAFGAASLGGNPVENCQRLYDDA